MPMAGWITLLLMGMASPLLAGEADLAIPDLGSVHFLGITGTQVLQAGLWVCLGGMLFGGRIYRNLRNLPVHRSMLEISELIYETCKTYLRTQLKFILLLWLFIGAIILVYFGWLKPVGALNVALILACSLLGIAGAVSVAWFGIRINTFANSRTAFASLAGKPYPCSDIPLKAGISIGMLLISIELFLLLAILLGVPGNLAGYCFIGFAIGESLGAAALRIAGGIFTKIADIGSDLMKIVFNIKEDDARNPGVIADCTGDNAGDSVGPTADGFETYGVTGVALITFILLAVPEPQIQSKLLVWIFAMRILMIPTSGLAYTVNSVVSRALYGEKARFDFEAPLTNLVWITSFISILVTYLASAFMIGDLGDGSLWWKLASIITCGTLAGAIIPEVVKIFTSVRSHHVQEVVYSSREGGASLNILSGFVAGNFSAFWMGFSIVLLMGVAFFISKMGLDGLMVAPAVFAFGLVAFGFLGMGPVTIAVDSYGPVTDNAQSVFELSTIESIKGIGKEIERDFGFKPDFKVGKEHLEENDGAGNTFKATAKPVLIGTAVVGATTLVFSIVVLLARAGSAGEVTQAQLDAVAVHFSLLDPMFLLGLISGGAVIYWFTGASTQAVSTGAFRAVEFIKGHIKLDSGSPKASVADSKRVVEICTLYAQKGMLNIFIALFAATLSFAFLDPDFFIGYLVGIAISGLYQAIFMANAGGAWDNAKKIVETTLKQKGTALHNAAVVGDTVGDPFKDTSSVAMNPVIKFTTLFGLLAVELAISPSVSPVARAIVFLLFLSVALHFVWRSFYLMRINVGAEFEKVVVPIQVPVIEEKAVLTSPRGSAILKPGTEPLD
ncbi:MAG TPA: sodium-translocating pyrophosphatase [bacterium]|nr:sodium-translocating pyrophosphatase [bacterium]